MYKTLFPSQNTRLFLLTEFTLPSTALNNQLLSNALIVAGLLCEVVNDESFIHRNIKTDTQNQFCSIRTPKALFRYFHGHAFLISCEQRGIHIAQGFFIWNSSCKFMSDRFFRNAYCSLSDIISVQLSYNTIPVSYTHLDVYKRQVLCYHT